MEKSNYTRLKRAAPVLAYLVANVLILLVRGVFWDDWAFYENPVGIRQILNGVGAPWQIGLHLSLLDFSHFLGIDQVFLYRSLILIIGFLNVLLFRAILSYWTLNKEIIFYSTLLYAVWPLGYAHVEMCCFVYQVGLSLQLISILLFHLYNSKKSLYIIIPLFACTQFLATMFLTSSVVLWLGYLFVYTYKDINIPDSFKNTISYIFNKTRLRNILWFIPCIALLVIKFTFWHTEGLYAMEAYNEITVKSLLMLPINILFAFANTFGALFTQFAGIIQSKQLVLVVLMVLAAIWLILRRVSFNDEREKLSSKTLIAFVLLFLSAIGAYVAIGKVPKFDSMDDRHGIFIPFVLVTFIALLVNSLVKEQKLKRIIFVMFAAVSMTYSFSQYVDCIYYSQRNDAIMSMFQNYPMPPGNVIVAEKESKTRTNYYTWSGLYKRATGRQDKCFMTINYGDLFDQKDYFLEKYNQRDAFSGEPSIGLFIYNEFIHNESTGFAKTLLLECYYRLNRTKYKESLHNKFEIKVEFFESNKNK
jgi:hypothetical protein